MKKLAPRNTGKLIGLLVFLFIGELAYSNTDSTWVNWKFRISPHFWYIGFTGDIVKPPFPTILPAGRDFELDIGFRDLSQNIKFIFMLSGEYRAKRIMGQFNYSGLILEEEAVTPLDLLVQNIKLRLDYHSGDFGAGYRIVKHPKVDLDAILGIKFIYFKIGAVGDILGRVPLEGERNKLWVDPLLGVKIRYVPHPRIEFMSYADVSGVIFGSEFSYQYYGLVSFVITKRFLISAGYRLWSIRAERKEAIYNGKVKGWITKIGFQF